MSWGRIHSWPQNLRRAIAFGSLFYVATVAQTFPALADYSDAKSNYDNLDSDSRISIILGLIATGDFVGLQEFGFTKRFYNGVRAFQAREGFVADGTLDERELRRLNERSNPFYSALGVKTFTNPISKAKLLVPRLAFDTEKLTSNGLSFERDDENLSLSFIAYPDTQKSFSQLYESLAKPTALRQISYSRVMPRFFVANGTFKGRYFYTWISAVPGGSTGFSLSWSTSWNEAGSRISILLANSFDPMGTTTEAALPEAQTEGDEPGAAEQPKSGTGTGIKLSTQGHVLTNFHVAGHCKSIALKRTGEPLILADLVASDEVNDLVLLKAKSYVGGPFASFVNGPAARAGSEIVVYGFPLGGILSEGGNIVTGNITALSGISNDSRHFQISAPVQPGNSGGPVLDRSGLVVAVVVSKLNAMVAEKYTGDIPQNVNFAIKANVAMSFLDGAGFNYSKMEPKAPLDTPAIADMAREFTLLVECNN